MRCLFDQGTPAPLRRSFPAGSVDTAAERGWSDLANGELLSAAEEAGFDILVTTDRNLKYQQNLGTRTIAIAVVLEPAWPLLKDRAADVAARIAALEPGAYVEI